MAPPFFWGYGGGEPEIGAPLNGASFFPDVRHGPLLMDDDRLRANLQALAGIDRSLVQWIETARDSPYVTPFQNDSGLANLRLTTPQGSLTLYDPGDTPVRLSHFTPEDDYPAGDVTILSGLGLGHEAAAVLSRADGRHQVWVLEPDALITRLALSSTDLSSDLRSGRFRLIPPVEEGIDRFLEARVKTLVYGQIKVHLRETDLGIGPEYARLQNHLFQALNAILARPHLLSLTGPATVHNLIRNLVPLSQGPDLSRLEGRFAGRPAVVVSAGPSLGRALPHLIRVKDRTLILGAVQALKVLLAHDVRPDLAVALDHTETVMDLGQDLWGAADVPLVVRPGIWPEFVRRWGGPVLTVPDERAFWEQPAPLPPARNAASLAVAAARYLGAEPVILIGCDFVLGPGALPGQMARRLDEVDEDEVIQVPGQDGRPRPTLPAYLFGRMDLEKTVAQLGGAVLNASVGGARIAGTTDLDPARMDQVLPAAEIDRSPLAELSAEEPDRPSWLGVQPVQAMAGSLADLARRARDRSTDLEAVRHGPEFSSDSYARAERAVAECFDRIQSRALWLYLFHPVLEELGARDYRLSFEEPRDQAWRRRRADLMADFFKDLAPRAEEAAAGLETAARDLLALEVLKAKVASHPAAWRDLAEALSGHDLLTLAGACLERGRDLGASGADWDRLIVENRLARGRWDLPAPVPAESEAGGIIAREVEAAADRARRLLDSGDYVTAIIVARRARTAAPDHPTAGRVLDAAIKMRDDRLEKLGAESTQDPLAQAEGLLKDRKFEEALKHYQDALEAAGSETEAMPAARGIIICLRALDRPRELEKFCRLMQRRLPGQALFDCELGDLLMARDEMDQAAEVIARGVAKDDRFSIFWAKLATAFMKRGHAARAVECLEKTIQADPDSYQAYFHLAQCHAALKRINEAVRDLDRCLEIEPDFVPALQFREELLAD